MVRKVVPVVVMYLREELAKQLLASPALTGCAEISLNPVQFAAVRNALKTFVCIADGQTNHTKLLEESKSDLSAIEILDSDS
mmetsp:Transcript_35492/g.43455  ORF Transcript_35492/g.43455 Transcript_35492/m.43455 type:complete len:82 (+) Transcript_35492:158-403(+)